MSLSVEKLGDIIFFVDINCLIGHICPPEMDWHLITRESPDFSHREFKT